MRQHTRITILWSGLASYSVAFFRELALSQGFRIQLIFQKGDTEAPYEAFDLSFCEMAIEDSIEVRQKLQSLVDRFEPDCVLMTSWAFSHFMQITRKLRKRGVYVVSAIDNQWRATVKQHLGILSAPVFLWPSIDTFFVTGERQAAFARKLGYDDPLFGFYAAEVERFFNEVSIAVRPRAFLYVGRLVPVKNISELAKAYRLYREKSEKTWSLRIAGTGPLTDDLKKIPGVELLGFVQPDDLPGVMKAARCLVLPSLWEPWGVVVQEAAAAGLPVIASYNCGAVTSYLHDGVNGYIVPPRADEIASAMTRISRATDEALLGMSRAGVQLANLWSPSKLAAYFNAEISERMAAGPIYRRRARISNGAREPHSQPAD
jgi:glycosyltransferase involved in cell wall biosynthesis